MKSHGTGKMCLLYQEVLISGLFSICLTITGLKNVVHSTRVFVI